MSALKTYFDLNFLQNRQRYAREVVGIKLSGKCLDDFEIRRDIVRQIIELKTMGAQIAVVHGGGRQITEECKKHRIEKREIEGLRYTTNKELEIATECVGGLTDTLVRDFHELAAEMGLNTTAMGMNGYDGKIITAELHSAAFEGSRTGKIIAVDGETLRDVMKRHVLVMNSICAGNDGLNWNVNADDVIAEVAMASQAKLVVMCSDTALYDKNGNTISRLYTDDIQSYVDDGTFNDQLAPKVKAIAEIAAAGCPVAIVDGRQPNAIAMELYTEEGGGTRIERRAKPQLSL